MEYDVIVIGGGHNSLTAAGLLGKAGRKVLVLEARGVLGGLAALEEFHPGYRSPGVLHDTACVRRGVADALSLERHGLRFRSDEVPTYLCQHGGGGLLLFRDAAAGAPEIRNFSRADADRYPEFRAFLDRIRPFFQRLTDQPAPELQELSLGHLFELAGSALALRRLAEKDMLEVLRIGPMCIADWLNEWFEGKLLKAGIAHQAVIGSWLGPWSAGSVVTFLLGELSADREVEGGAPALIQALAKACESNGVEIRTHAPVARLRPGSVGMAGVSLADGTEIEAPVVVSGCDPKRTFLTLMSPRSVPAALAETISLWRTRGTTAKVNLALSGPLEFSGRPGARIEAARTGEEPDDLERAFDAVKYGRFSEAPILDLRVPSVTDPSLAPAGHHVVSMLVHYAPYHLRGGWTDESRKTLGEAAVEALAKHVPTLRERLLSAELLTPTDLEERYGATEGHLLHGEPALDQLFSLRPHPSCARHATPIPGLFLASGGTHPGGGISCAPGALCARAVLRAKR